MNQEEAEIGFPDGSRGTISLDELLWAREWQAEQEVGPEPTRASDVLNRGDVVLVEPLFIDDPETEGRRTEAWPAAGTDAAEPALTACARCPTSRARSWPSIRIPAGSWP